MSEDSLVDCQIWFPGPTEWQLWLVEDGHQGLIKRRDIGDQLEFEHGARGPKVLALPATAQIAFPFLSNAMDGESLLESARLHIERQGSGYDFEGVMAEPVFGSPPNTMVRIDAPIANQQTAYQCNYMPDLIVPAATLVPHREKGITIWGELNRISVAFERDGRAIYYDILSGGQGIVEELQQLQYRLEIDQLIQHPSSVTLIGTSYQDRFKECKNWQDTFILEPEIKPQPPQTNYTMRPSWYRDEMASRDQVLAQKNRRKRGLAIAGVVALCLIALIAVSFLQSHRIKSQLSDLRPKAEKVRDIQNRWQELATAIDPDSSHLETWLELYKIPSITSVELSKLDIGKEAVIVSGTAGTAPRALQFIDEVMTNETLASFYKWNHDPPGIDRNGKAVFELKGVAYEYLTNE